MRPRRICCPSTAPCLAKPGHGIAPAPVADCRLCAPAHLLPQYCTLLGKTRPRHRPRTGRRLQTVPPRTLPPRRCQFAPPAHPTRYYQTTRPGAASSHPLPTPPGTTRALAPASHPQTPPAKPNPTKRRTPRPPNGRRGVNTQRGVSARRLTRQLRKSPRPQRRHLRCRLLARPLRERQRPQEQQR